MGIAKLLLGAVTGKGKSMKTGRGAQVLNNTMKDIDGKPVDLNQYRGQVLMLVNVASKCGLTPQYEQLVKLRSQYHEQGFEILGFPANDFMGQEPGTESEIKSFCATTYDVNFPLFSKVTVKGADKAPLYDVLTSNSANGDLGGDIVWNFTKFVVGRDGRVVGRVEPQIPPDDPKVIALIEQELGK